MRTEEVLAWGRVQSGQQVWSLRLGVGQVHRTGSKSPLKSQLHHKCSTPGQVSLQKETMALWGEVNFIFFLNGLFFFSCISQVLNREHVLLLKLGGKKCYIARRKWETEMVTQRPPSNPSSRPQSQDCAGPHPCRRPSRIRPPLPVSAAHLPLSSLPHSQQLLSDTNPPAHQSQK